MCLIATLLPCTNLGKLALTLCACCTYWWCAAQHIDLNDEDYLQEAIQYSKATTDDQDALAYIVAALDEIQPTQVSDTLLADVYHRKGIHHYYLDEEPQAIAAWQQAIKLRANMLPTYHLSIVKSYRNIGNAYVFLEDFQAAQTALQQALDLNLSNPQPDTTLLTALYGELGHIYSEQGDVQKADPYLKNAQHLGELLFADAPQDLAQIYDYQYLHAKKQDQPIRMIFFAQKSLKQIQSIKNKSEENEWRISDIYNNMAIAYEQLKKHEQAITFYSKALSINQKYAARKYALAQNHANLIGIYRKRHDFATAAHHAQQALQLVKTLDSPSLHSLILHNRAEIYADQAQYLKAIEGYHQAVNLLVPSFQTTTILEHPNTKSRVLGDKPNLIFSLQEKAWNLLQLGKANQELKYLNAAVATYDSIAQYIDQVRFEVDSDESKSFLTERAQPIFERAIEANLILYDYTKDLTQIENAFDFVERSKAVILLDAVQESQAKVVADIPKDLLKRERQWRDSLQKIEQQLLEVAPPTSTHLQNQLLTTHRQLERLIDTLEQQFPAYHHLKYTTTLTSLHQVQDQ
ncbi:MAG: tetratricopeptide repeat protein, partial [Bacteroidota bacterium]